MSIAGYLPLTSGGVELDVSPDRFGFLADSTELLGDMEALRERMDRDGYLFLPGFLDRQDVKDARQAVCMELHDEGLLDPTAPIEDAVAKPGVNMAFRPDVANGDKAGRLIRHVIYGDRMMSFFSSFLGGEARHYDFTWMRTIAPGIGSLAHCDVIFMGRGTHNLYTAWVPFGDIPLSVGGLLLLEGSHRYEPVLDTYCKLDYDTSCQTGENPLQVAGYLSSGAIGDDIRKIQDVVGGRLLTAENYRMGDLLIFSVFLIHGSLDNQSKEIRLSTDSRYQLASEPLDERWVGEHPPGHGGASVKGTIC